MKCFLVIFLLSFSFSVQAATVIYSAPGIVTAIEGVEISGSFYDVDFETGSYSTFGGQEDFWSTATEVGLAVDAIVAILNGVAVTNINNSQGFTKPAFTVQGGAFIDVDIGQTFDTGSGAILDVVWANVGAGTFNALDYSLNTAWSSSVVPIPAAVWLFGSALAGLGWMRRKQTV